MKTRNELAKLFTNEKGVGAEIGVQYGYFSKQISQDWSGKILCVDTWTDPDVFAKSKEELRGDQFIITQGSSVEVSKTIEDESLDWIYIDADHSKEAVKADYEAWFPKVRKGGIISGHDYGVNDCIGVKEFLDESGLKFELTTDDFWQGREYQTWWFVKE